MGGVFDSAKNNNDSDDNSSDADKAGFEQERSVLILNDFFG